ncbi:tRNA (adenosine(37)-N6)-threonylcarbamoyltransferase complex ATPase subunit type 1 TsaE [Desulfonauticus submarinus]
MQINNLNLNKTQKLAHLLGNIFSSTNKWPIILLEGSLGAGKTTFVRFFIENFPQGELAEVSSPSFNILNLYPTIPEIAHLDLYRLSSLGWDDFLEEIIFDPFKIKFIEWSNFLPKSIQLEDYLKISIQIEKNLRTFSFTAKGSGRKILSQLNV